MRRSPPTTGLDAVDAGHKRRAYRLPDRLVNGDRPCTLKVAYSLNGYYENRCEVAWWRGIPGDAGWVGEDVTKPAQYGRVDGDPVVVDYGRADFLDPVE